MGDGGVELAVAVEVRELDVKRPAGGGGGAVGVDEGAIARACTDTERIGGGEGVVVAILIGIRTHGGNGEKRGGTGSNAISGSIGGSGADYQSMEAGKEDGIHEIENHPAIRGDAG